MFNCFSFSIDTNTINNKLTIFQTLKTKIKHKLTNCVNDKSLQLFILITNNNNADNAMPEFLFLNNYHKHGYKSQIK